MDGELSLEHLEKQYYLELAAAFVRGKLGNVPPLPPEQLIALGWQQGLRLHKFKRSAELPRVRKVLGILRGLAPSSLLDVGSGRGVFLWPLVDAFPGLPITAIDQKPQRIEDIEAVIAGGFDHLSARAMDVCCLELEEDCADIVTILEVLEHLPEPARASREVLRVARRFVVVSVPSREDNNPEHIQLFTRDSLQALFLDAGAKKVNVEFVLNHMIAVVKVA